MSIEKNRSVEKNTAQAVETKSLIAKKMVEKSSDSTKKGVFAQLSKDYGQSFGKKDIEQVDLYLSSRDNKTGENFVEAAADYARQVSAAPGGSQHQGGDDMKMAA